MPLQSLQILKGTMFDFGLGSALEAFWGWLWAGPV